MAAIAIIDASAGPLLAASPKPLAVVISRTSPIKELNLEELRRLFSGENIRADDQHLIPFNHPPRSPGRIAFDRSVLELEPDEVAKYWIDRKIRGKKGPPRSVDSVGLLRRVVAKLDGAIAYLESKHVENSLRVLRVDGKLPGDEDYPVLMR